MGRLEDYYQSQAGLQQNGNTQQPVGSIVLPTLDTTNPIGSLAELLGPTPAEREAQERRMMQNRSKMQAWMGLFDGLRQLGNLYYATKGATPQTYNNPYQLVDNEIQQQRQLRDGITNYKRQYATSLYNLQRQMEADKRTNEEHKAKLDWYKNRDEQNAEKVAIQRLKAENDAAYKDATLEEKKRMNDIMADVYAGRISLMEAQEQLAKVKAAHVGTSGGGRSNGTYGYRTTKHVDPATGDVITERVPTTGNNPSNADNKSRYDKYRKGNQGSSQSSNKWDKYKKN